MPSETYWPKSRSVVAWGVLAAVGLLAYFFVEQAGNMVLDAEAASARAAIRNAHNWGYQLQGPNPRTLARTKCDVLVVDYSRTGRHNGAFSAGDVQTMRGSGKLVLAYLSIGEAEDYRFYWRSTWRNSPPGWLGRENRRWGGNYKVRYWEQDWQSIIFAYADRIVKAGFDGIYLDRVDAYYEWKERPTARQEMVSFVIALAAHARGMRPGFAVVPQNGEALLSNEGYLGTIDAIAKEDLFYGAQGDGRRNSEEETETAIAHLNRARRADRPVFLVEYVSGRKATEIRTRARELGFVPLTARRDLDTTPSCQ